MASFAVMLRSQPPSAEAILLMIDDRPTAEEIAVELCRRGHPVDVREITGTVDGRASG